MTPVAQTRLGRHGNCFAACVATILDKRIEDVDVNVSSFTKPSELMRKIEEKIKCKIYGFPHDAITDGAVISTERYCIVDVCTSLFDNDADHPMSMWHAVVCEIADGGKLNMVFNPESDTRKRLQDFNGMRNLYIVKCNVR
jgi:hypothetical protein